MCCKMDLNFTRKCAAFGSAAFCPSMGRGRVCLCHFGANSARERTHRSAPVAMEHKRAQELYCPGWWMGLPRFFGPPLYDAVHVASGNRHFEAPYRGIAQQPRPFRFDAPGWAVTQMGFARWFMHRKTRTLPTCPARPGVKYSVRSQCVLVGKSSLLVINF